MTEARHLVIAAGGTGGHMFPAQALAEAMVQRGWRVTLSTDARGARYTQRFPDQVRIKVVGSGSFSQGGALAKLRVPFRILGGIGAAVAGFIAARPAVVVGFGGYPSIPALAAAWLLRVPRMIHEQNGVLGRVNRVFARRVGRIACGTWPTVLPAGVAAEHVGNPVRGAIRDVAGAPYHPPEAGPICVLVMGGSQGARILSQVVPAAIVALPEPLRARVRLSQQARDEDITPVRAVYAQAGIDADVQSFFSDIPARMAEAQLVISRAGASSVAEIAAVGRPSILIPYGAAMDDHQTANARALIDAEAAIGIPETAFEPTTLAAQMVAVLTDAAAAERMAANALAQGRPDATERLVGLVEDMARAT